MTTLHEKAIETKLKLTNAERRAHRRADMEGHEIAVERWDGNRRVAKPFGKIMDISAGGVRIRTTQQNVRADNQIRLRLELPEYAGITPFLDHNGPTLTGKREWVGWLAVSRVSKVDGKNVEVAGRLVDMDYMDRGMLGLYLSTQPLAA
jgi:hypothetical protein